MSNTNANQFTPFHSSVNRIPSSRVETAKQSKRSDSEYLSDHSPQELSEIRQDTLSGSISVELTVETPLIIGEQRPQEDQKRNSEDKPRVKTISPITVNNEVYVPPTSIKGMISSAYEAVTNSRFRLFGKYDKPLTYRFDPATAARLTPVRIGKTSGGKVLIQLLDGSSSRNKQIFRGEPPVPVVMSASLYDDSTEGITFSENTNHQQSHFPSPGGSGTPFSRFIAATSPKTGEPFPKVYFDAVLVNNGLYAYWIITKLYRTSDSLNPTHTFHIDFTTLGLTKITEEFNLTGYLYTTTQSQDRKDRKKTFANKKSERVFFTLRETPNQIEVPEEKADILFSRYKNTVQSYIENYEKREERKRRRLNRASNGDADLVPNRFVTDKSWSIEDEGALAYAFLTEDQQEVTDLVPINLGRMSYIDSPESIAFTNKLAPPTTAEEASAADRLFGFTTRKSDSTAESAPSYSVRGRLSFSVINTSRCSRYDGDPLPLTPLLSPNPSSARRFLTRQNGNNIQSADDQMDCFPRSTYFKNGDQSLGRAAYPTHRSTLKLPASERVLPPYESGEDAFTVINSYIKPGSKMTFRIQFEMLSPTELGILLWLLNPHNLVPRKEKDGDRVGYMRLGMGKSLGLGTVKVEAIECSLINGQELAVGYQELKHVLGTDSVVDLDSYPVPANFEDHRWVQAFQRAAFGYSDGVEVRYMTRKENQRNNATDHNSGLPKHGCAIEPRQLFPSNEQDQSPLPIHVTTSPKTQCNPRH